MSLQEMFSKFGSWHYYFFSFIFFPSQTSTSQKQRARDFYRSTCRWGFKSQDVERNQLLSCWRDIRDRSSRDSVTCLSVLPRKPSSNVLSDQRQVRGVGRRQEGSASLRIAQRFCQGGYGRPHFLHPFRAAPASNPVAIGSQQETGSDDFHLLDTFFWGFVFLFKMSQWCLCVINTGRVLEGSNTW